MRWELNPDCGLEGYLHVQLWLSHLTVLLPCCYFTGRTTCVLLYLLHWLVSVTYCCFFMCMLCWMGPAVLPVTGTTQILYVGGFFCPLFCTTQRECVNHGCAWTHTPPHHIPHIMHCWRVDAAAPVCTSHSQLCLSWLLLYSGYCVSISLHPVLCTEHQQQLQPLLLVQPHIHPVIPNLMSQCQGVCTSCRNSHHGFIIV